MCMVNQATGGGVLPPAAAAPAAPVSGGGALPSDLPGLLAKLTEALGALSNVLSTMGGASALAPSTSGGGGVPTPGQQLPTAPPLPGAGSAPVSSAREGVLMIGDSLSVGTKQYFNEALTGMPTTVDATGGIPLKEGMRRYDATADKPRVVEMALFTNNQPGQIEELRSAIQKTVDDARQRGGRVVWATIVRPGNYDAVNAMIREFAQKNPDVMKVVDWEQMVQQNPSYLAGDKIHGTAAGYKARAQAFADAAK